MVPRTLGFLLLLGACAPATSSPPSGSATSQVGPGPLAPSAGAGSSGGGATRAVTADSGAPRGAVDAAPRLPLSARFVADFPARVEARLCTRVLVAVAQGKVEGAGVSLAEGDTLVVTHGAPFELRGAGLAAVAVVDLAPCDVLSRPPPRVDVARAGAAPKLSWAKGTMAAHLDVDKSLSPEAYVGRLEGTGAVGEHVHEGSWEVLFALDARGTFVLDGVAHRLGPRTVVFVPPGSKHAWTPDPGSALRAVQMYVPPGPEQRFKALAEGSGAK